MRDYFIEVKPGKLKKGEQKSPIRSLYRFSMGQDGSVVFAKAVAALLNKITDESDPTMIPTPLVNCRLKLRGKL